MIHNLRRRMHARNDRVGSGGKPAQSHSPKRSFGQAGRRIVSLFAVSLLSAGIFTTGLTAGIVALGTIGATSASADETTGYYTRGNGISGFCVDPGLSPPGGRTYVKGTKFGNDVTKVLSWFATHYGPSGTDQGGGSAYNSASADPLLAGLSGNGSPTDITTAIQVDIVKAEGGTPNRAPQNQLFADQLLNFARTYQAPWTLKIALNSNGPYKAGTAYGGTLAINDKFGQRVPVRGINIAPTGQTNASISMAQGETTGDGSVTFTYTPAGDGPFDAQFVTSDVAGRAPIYEDVSAPGGYQRLMTPERADSSADLRGSVISPAPQVVDSSSARSTKPASFRSAGRCSTSITSSANTAKP